MAASTQPSAGYDAIVVGGGHNGLVAAAYLAKAGLRTLVLEKRATLGGTVETRTLDDGSRAPGLFHTVGRLRPAVYRELDLGARGLSLVAPEVRAFAPAARRPGGHPVGRQRPDGGRPRDLVGRRLAGLGRRSTARSGRWPGFLAALGEQAPPPTSGPAWPTRSRGSSSAGPTRSSAKDDARNLLRVLPDGGGRLRRRILRDRCGPGDGGGTGDPVHRAGRLVDGHDRDAARRFRRQRRRRGGPGGLREGRSRRAERTPWRPRRGRSAPSCGPGPRWSP